MSNDEVVSASELGEFVYCRRAWWLRRIVGVAPREMARKAMAAGQAWHTERWEAMTEGWQWQRALACIGGTALAMGAVLLLLWWWRR